jgi:tRNA (guanosine-2'-O-)-methyltransferase
VTRQLRPTEVKRLNRQWRRRTEGRLCLLLDSVTSPFNVGAILRTSAALGVDHVWLAGNSASPQHPSSRKTSLGTERLVDWSLVESAAGAADEAAAGGLFVVGIELADGAVPLPEARLEGDLCVALGNEDHGLSPALLARCGLVAYVPQVGRVGSLNVATAAGIALYDVRRRAWSAAGSHVDTVDEAGPDLDTVT